MPNSQKMSETMKLYLVHFSDFNHAIIDDKLVHSDKFYNQAFNIPTSTCSAIYTHTAWTSRGEKIFAMTNVV